MQAPPGLFQDWTAAIPVITLVFGAILLFAGRRMHGFVVGLLGFGAAFPFGVPIAVGISEASDGPVHAGLIAFSCLVAGIVGLVLALTLERFLVFAIGFMSGWLGAALGFGGDVFAPEPERFAFGFLGAVALLGLFLIGRTVYSSVVGAALAANGFLLLVDETEKGFPAPESFFPLTGFLFALGLAYQLIVGWKDGRARRAAEKQTRLQAAVPPPVAFTPTGPPRPASTFDHIRHAPAPYAPPAWASVPPPAPAPVPPPTYAAPPVYAPAPVYQPAPVIVNNNIHITPGPHGWQIGAPPQPDGEGWGLSSLRTRREPPPV